MDSLLIIPFNTNQIHKAATAIREKYWAQGRRELLQEDFESEYRCKIDFSKRTLTFDRGTYLTSFLLKYSNED